MAPKSVGLGKIDRVIEPRYYRVTRSPQSPAEPRPKPADLGDDESASVIPRLLYYNLLLSV